MGMLNKYLTLKQVISLKNKKSSFKYLTLTYTKNNIFITYYSFIEKKLFSISAGQLKDYKKFEKKTFIASEILLQKVIEILKTKKFIINSDPLIINIKGIDKFNTETIQLLLNKKLNIFLIKDITGIPHGGCRLPK